MPTKPYLQEMVARNEGAILQLASLTSELLRLLQSVYHAIKTLMLSFTESIQEENKDSRVTLTALLPDFTDSDFFNKAQAKRAR